MKNNKSLQLNFVSEKALSLRIPGYLSAKTDDQQLKSFLRLDLGENLHWCSDKALETCRHIDRHLLQHYANPAALLIRKKIAKNMGCEIKNILIGTSSDEIIEFIAKVFLDPGDRVVIVQPNFFRFSEASQKAGGKVVDVFALNHENYEYTPRLVDETIQSINDYNAKILWLSNPVNPTGNLIDEQSLRKIAQETRALIVIDEAFIEYCLSGEQSIAGKLIKDYQNVIILRTFSKAYGLAGLRFGYMAGHKKTIQQISQLRTLMSMTSGVVQHIALSVLDDWSDLLKYLKKIRLIHENLKKEIDAIPGYQRAGNSHSNVYLLRHRKKDLYQELKQQGILVSDFSKMPGLKRKRFVRITVGTDEQNITLLKALRKIA